jgi:hypothetical protein
MYVCVCMRVCVDVYDDVQSAWHLLIPNINAGRRSTLNRVLDGTLARGKVKILAGDFLVHINDVITCRLKMCSRIVTFCHENIITGRLIRLRMEDILRIDKLFLDGPNQIKRRLQLGFMIVRFGRCRDKRKPLVLGRDIMGGRHTAHVDVMLSIDLFLWDDELA